MFRRTETQRDDDARSVRLLQGMEDRPDAARCDDAFDRTVLGGCMQPSPGTPYPPTGHNYPRKG